MNSSASTRVSGASTTSPPAMMSVRRAAGPNGLGHALSSSEYAVQESIATRIQASPTVNSTWANPLQ